MPRPTMDLPRRRLLAAAIALPFLPRLALAAPRNLAFAVFRNDVHIGEHYITFAGDGEALTATIEADMVVRLGPVPVFRYRHHAVETVRGGAFANLESRTTSNGKREHLVAERTASGVDVDGPVGRAILPADIGPLTNWNPKAFPGPFFNPQTGKPLKLQVSRVGPGRWSLRGEVEIDDVYDEAGAWLSTRARGTDGSALEYRRI